MTRIRALASLVHLLLLFQFVSAYYACVDYHCRCYNGTHPHWFVVNCTLDQYENLDFSMDTLPKNTNELIVTGGKVVRFRQDSLSDLQDPRLVRVSDTSTLHIQSFTGTDIQAINFIIDIRNIDNLFIDKYAFTGVKGPISVDILDVNDAEFGDTAFSWLLKLSIKGVMNLKVNSGSFMLSSLAPNVGEHGPGMTITIMDSIVERIPAHSFASSAAAITLMNVEIGRIYSNAFSANTYNSVQFNNCSIMFIENEAFGKKTLIYEFQIYNSDVTKIFADALISGVSSLDIFNTTFDYLAPRSIKGTYASVKIDYCTFRMMNIRSFVFTEWNSIRITNSKFDHVPPMALSAIPTSSSNDFVFRENQMKAVYPHSLKFVGLIYEALSKKYKPVYKNNYYGHGCSCNLTGILSLALGLEFPINLIKEQSHCTVNSEIAYCFNVPEKNMRLKSFLKGICVDNTTIKCEPSELNVTATEIKNPRFPQKTEATGLSTRNMKAILITIITCVGAFLLAIMITFIRWMRRKGYCYIGKRCSTSSCICNRMCDCRDGGLENAGSLSQVNVHEMSELHRLNEPRVDIIQETTLPQMYTEDVIQTDNKTTQTLPEELTKELLENLKEKLDDPEKYVEAREMIEHLYELINIAPTANENREVYIENIYEIPLQETMPRLGKNNKTMVSVGTRTPSIERLQPVSPYNRGTSLAHEYFEPRDFAIHLYAEIANCDKEKKIMLGVIPDVVGDQMLPRGPYLRAMREKEASTNAYAKPVTATDTTPNNMSSIKSGRSMQNRPLPRKPVDAGTSYTNQ